MIKENKGLAMHWQVIIGLLLGIVYAWMSIQFGWNEFTLNWIQPFGDIFINILKLIAVPLVLFSIISGVASLGDMRKLGRMGIKTLALYLTTTMFAVIVGLTLVNVFKPGDHASDALREANRIRYELWRDANDIVRLDEINFTQDPELEEMVATIKGESIEHNEWVNDKLTKADRTKTSGPLQPLVDVVPKNIFKSLSDMQMLQIIFFAIFFGVVVTGLKDDQKGTIVRAVNALNEVFVQMVWVVMKIMPLFVFALMAGQIVKAAGNRPRTFSTTSNLSAQIQPCGSLGSCNDGLPLVPAYHLFICEEYDLEAVHLRNERCPNYSLLHFFFGRHFTSNHELC